MNRTRSLCWISNFLTRTVTLLWIALAISSVSLLAPLPVEAQTPNPPFDLGAYLGSDQADHLVAVESYGGSIYVFGSFPAWGTISGFPITTIPLAAPFSLPYPQGNNNCYLAKLTPDGSGGLSRDSLVLLPSSDECHAMAIASDGEVFTARRIAATATYSPMTVIESFSFAGVPQRTRFNVVPYIWETTQLRVAPGFMFAGPRAYVLGTCQYEQEVVMNGVGYAQGLRLFSSLDSGGLVGGFNPYPVSAAGTLNCLNSSTPRQSLLLRIRADGGNLEYGTFFGLSDSTQLTALETDGATKAYVAGQTSEALYADYQLWDHSNAYQPQLNGGVDAFLMVIDTDSALWGHPSLVYESYFGGADDDVNVAMSIEPGGHLLLARNTASPPGSGVFNGDIFLSEFDTSKPPSDQLVMNWSVMKDVSFPWTIPLLPPAESSARMRFVGDGKLAFLAQCGFVAQGIAYACDLSPLDWSPQGNNPLLLVYDPIVSRLTFRPFLGYLPGYPTWNPLGTGPRLAPGGQELYIAMQTSEAFTTTDGSSPTPYTINFGLDDVFLLGLNLNYVPGWNFTPPDTPMRAVAQSGAWQPVTVTFPPGSINSWGRVYANPIDPANLPSANFTIIGTAYDVTTTVDFTGSIQVCFLGTFPNGSLIKHYDLTLSPPNWVTVGTVSSGTACGTVTSLSPLAVAEPTVGSDMTPPVLALPVDISAEATGPSGAGVTFTATANDAVDGPVAVTCRPASGSTFSLGTTVVNCSATDAAGNLASGSFNVSVVDTTKPTLNLPANVAAEAASSAGAIVTYSTSATDLVSGNLTPGCTPASGSTYPLGATTVNCSATDAAGNTGTGSFTVTVRDTTLPTISCGSADGLWHNANVGIACTASDRGSGLANTADASFTLSTSVAAGTETANAPTGSRSVCDNAANCATAGPVSGNKIDLKAPTITITSPTATTYAVGQVINAAYACTDGGSGIASCVGTLAAGSAIDTSTIGTKTFTVNAGDAVGNPATASVTYTVSAAHLKLVKTVTNDNGGTAVATNFTLTASGPTTISGAGGAESDVNAGTYTLSETNLPGYMPGSWSCVGGSQNGASITLALGQSATCTINNNDQQAHLTLINSVINDNGGTKQVSGFPLFINGSAATSGVAYALNAGSYTAGETGQYGYSASSWGGDCAANGSITLHVGDNKTCTITNNDQPGTIMIQKIAKPTTASTSFSFQATGPGYSGFSLSSGQTNTQVLNAGSYTVKELVPLGWVLTGIGQDPADPSFPYNCKVTGSGGSTGVGDLNTQTATISLNNGDTVLCVFENTGRGVTRTQGFWATHTQLANIAWFGGTAFGHTFPGVAGVSGIGDSTLCGRPIDTLGKLMGVFWSSVSTASTGAKRSSLDQARMQLLQQLIAAELNASAFGSAPSSGSFALWESAYCGTNQTTIKNALQQAASFNTTGDSSTFTPGTSADSKNARALANYAFWDVLP